MQEVKKPGFKRKVISFYILPVKTSYNDRLLCLGIPPKFVKVREISFDPKKNRKSIRILY